MLRETLILNPRNISNSDEYDGPALKDQVRDTVAVTVARETVRIIMVSNHYLDPIALISNLRVSATRNTFRHAKLQFLALSVFLHFIILLRFIFHFPLIGIPLIINKLFR